MSKGRRSRCWCFIKPISNASDWSLHQPLPSPALLRTRPPPGSPPVKGYASRRMLEWFLRTHLSRPIRRCWIDAVYTEEEITLLEEEVLPAMAAFLGRVSEIERHLEAECGQHRRWQPCRRDRGRPSRLRHGDQAGR
ncbi:hypothetical protein NZK33_01375 [Cyanobium sp. FGCU-6]|nr:hypothetical protein [Cyanobium sp. FGCU6]